MSYFVVLNPSKPNQLLKKCAKMLFCPIKMTKNLINTDNMLTCFRHAFKNQLYNLSLLKII